MEVRPTSSEPSILDRVRDISYRVTHAVGYGIAGGLAGSVVGMLMRRPNVESADAAERSRVEGLKADVKLYQMLRQMGPVVISFFSEQEYRARRILESEGYYPCSRCGKPHKDGGPHADCMAKGTYWDKAREKYVEPDDPEWSAENYEQYTGERWDPGNLDDEDDEPQVH